MNKTVVITGGSSGIGLAAAELFRDKGYRVYELSRNERPREGIIHITADVSDRSSVDAAFNSIMAIEGHIDILVNNAGFGTSGPVEFIDPVDAHAQMEVNFFGCFNCIQAVLPHMRASRSDRIINLSSVAAPIAIPYQGFYSAAKAAISSLTLALRNEVRAHGIQVCAIQPGDVRTGFTAARKKSMVGADIYPAMNHAVAVMEHDEENGLPPEAVAKTIYRAATAKHCAAIYTVGAQYKLFTLINKLLPATLVNYLVGKIYR